VNRKRESVSPLNGFFLFLNHVCQLLEDGAQLNNCGLNVLHGVCPALDVRILQRRESVHEQQELLRVTGTRGNLMCPLSRGLRTFAFLPQTQNLKQQRSRREQFSRAPVSALPLAPNHLGKSQASQGALRGKA